MFFVFCYLVFCAILHTLSTGLYIGLNDRDSATKAGANFITAVFEAVCAYIVFGHLHG